MKRISLALLAAVALIATPQMAQAAYANSVTYSGQGLTGTANDGFNLGTTLCGPTGERAGSYILWILTATSSNNADITGPWGTATMTQSSDGAGTFKYVSDWYPLATLMASPPVATFDIAGRGNPQLTISHGCPPPISQDKPAWCSPGFWRNADLAAWQQTGILPSASFNSSAYPYFYGALLSSDPTLLTVLNNPKIYSGKPYAGTSGYALNAFNATGAYLTDLIPGYTFAWNLYLAGDDSVSCPLDHHGNLKDSPTTP